MKKYVVASLLVFSVLVAAQMPMFKPKELDKLNFMIGTWKGTETMNFGPQPIKAKGTVVSRRAVGDAYVEATYLSDMGAEKMHGRQLTTYDPAKKMYVGYWFDNASAGVMTMRGNFSGNMLRLVSDPVEVPGMEGKQVFRTSWTKVDARHVDFKLEMKQGPNWAPMISARYTKAR